MKKMFFLFSVFFCLISVYANDTFFYLSGGSLVPAKETEEVNIEMREEVIKLKFQPSYYEVTVDFEFYNPGKEQNLLIGFPFFEIGNNGKGKIYDFECWTNDKKTDYKDKPIDSKWKTSSNNNLKNAYTREITFAKKSITKTKISYKSTYGSATTSDSVATYLYGTGASWKNPIGKITLILENSNLSKYPRDIYIRDKSIKNEFLRVSDNTFKIDLYNVEPNYTDVFTIQLTSNIGDTGPKIFPYHFYYDRFPIEEQDLFWRTKAQLRIVRNTIYALHGYIFKSPDLIEYFSGEWVKNWAIPYTPNPNFTEDDLSQIEKNNIKAILEEEQSRK